MSEAIALLSRIEDVTPRWIAQVLAAGGLNDLHIEDFEAQSIGTGQVGENVRLALRYGPESAKGPASVVLKLPSVHAVSRATAVAQGIYAREVHFYTDLARTLKIRTPHCWYADLDEKGEEFVLVFEDMTPADQGDQLMGCSLRQAELAMDEAARLHAPRWNDPELSRLEWLSHPGPDTAPLLEAVYQSVLPGFEARFRDRVHEDVLGLARRFGEKIGGWARFDEGPRCVVHGDFRLDNMLFGIGDGPAPLAVVDWQTCAEGHPASDVAYFLGAGLLPEVRRETEKKLLGRYHNRLVEAGVEQYSMDDLLRDYQRFSFSGFIMAVVASQIVEASERGDAMFAVMAERHAEQIADLQAEDIL
ncbi:ecdysteroid 22-kinase family protein [Myxococcota bacterium]|nr:ecdysteroid 22-kinase family protein [Myxococcota bacterium]